MEKIPDNLLSAVPAPLEGVMSPAFLAAARHLHLAELYFTPFLRVSEHVLPEKVVRRFLAPYSGGIPIVLQLMGVDPEKLAATAKIARNCGVAGINFNFGCPSGTVVRGGAGSALLRDVPRMRGIVEAAAAAVPGLSLSVKMRIGFDSPDEMERLIPALELPQLDFRVIHARSYREHYAPVADMDARFRRILALSPRSRIVLNGDIGTPERLAQVRQWGATGAMCGRMWLKDPFLLCRARGESAPDAETGRRRFFAAVLAAAADSGCPCRAGQAIELSVFLWGGGNAYFARLLELQKRGDPVTCEALGLQTEW